MPIRPEFRQFYTAAAGWPATRRRILERAGGRFDQKGRYLGSARCERANCDVLDHAIGIRNGADFIAVDKKTALLYQDREQRKSIGLMRIVLTIAHLDHDPRNNDPSNLRAYCQYHHLGHDLPKHIETSRLTRITRKDAGRPLLAESETCAW